MTICKFCSQNEIRTEGTPCNRCFMKTIEKLFVSKNIRTGKIDEHKNIIEVNLTDLCELARSQGHLWRNMYK